MSVFDDRLRALTAAGYCVSFCYGPSGTHRVECWSVDVLSPNGQSFERPFMATSLEHCVEIAELEIARRGWVRPVKES